VKIKQIYLDMDGVLANFAGSAAALFHKNEEGLVWPEIVKSTGKTVSSIHVPLGLESEDELWDKINEKGTEFWENLEFYPWRDELWDLCESIADTMICTSPARYGECALGKTRWLQAWKGEAFRKYIFIPGRKHLLAAPGTVLIDDYDKKAEEFGTCTGAWGLIFPRKWNKKREFAADPVEYIRRCFKTIQRA
jgi:hypothetical protein